MSDDSNKYKPFLGTIGSTKTFTSWTIDDKDIPVAATVLAKFACLINPNIDEYEAYEITEDFMKEVDLNVVNVVDLVAMLKCTIYNEKFDKMH